MLPALRTRFDALETQRAAYLDPIRALPASAQQRKPDAGAWSLSELVHHLLLIDTQALGAMERRFAKGPRSAGATAGLRARLIRGVLALPLRIPAPPGAGSVLPRDTPDFAVLEAEWQRVRAAMQDLLATASPERVRASAFRHPLAGWFSLRDTLDFLHTHHAHHRPQRDRLLAVVAGEEPVG